MNKTRTLCSALLALMLAVCMIVPAMAEGGPGSITINNAVVGQDYTIYRILELESYNTTANAYAYKATTAWNTFINSTDIKGTYVEVDAQGYVTWKDGADAAAFAKAAQKYAKDNSIVNQGTVTATTTEVSFTGLELGYYLVDSTLGTLCSLNTTKPSVEMTEKNAVPENKKEVQEDSNNQYDKTNDADIGQTVNFKSTITAQAGAENYVFHDKMSAGLTYTGVGTITLTSGESTTTLTASRDYTVVTTGLSDGCTFEVRFTQDFCDTLKANDQIVISYTATVNENAVIGLPGNKNESKLSYGDSNVAGGEHNVTPPSETFTYTWDVDVLKYANDDITKVLKDAEFVLLNSDKSKVAIIVNGKVTGWDNVPDAVDGTITWPNNTVLTTDANGKIEIDGLDADTYHLREVKAPDGYNKLATDVDFTISGATEGEGGTLTYTTPVIEVNNQSGTELPSTGGIGTTVFYVVGGLLVVGAFILLVSKRRVGAEK